MSATSSATDLGAVFVIEDEKGVRIQKVFKHEIEARAELETLFMERRNHNWYLIREDFVPASTDGAARWERKEIGRRIRSNRFGGPRSL